MNGTSTAAGQTAALRTSLVWNAALSVIALALGVVLGIRILVFDGAFGLIGTATTWMALVAARKAAQNPTRRNPFGWPALVPLVVAIQGVAALATLAIAAGDAVIVILDGGQPVQVGVVAVYAVAVAAISTALAWWLSRTRTDLVDAEVVDWRSSAIRAAVVALGAGVAVLLGSLSLDGALPFVDPALVLVSCALVAPLPIGLIRRGVGELLEGAAPPQLLAEIEASAATVAAEHGLEKPIVRAAKLGHRLYLEVIFHVDGGRWRIEDQDAVRGAILERLGDVGLEIWPSIELTTDPDFR